MTWQPGRPLPDLELVNADSAPVRLASLRGQAVVLEVMRHTH